MTLSVAQPTRILFIGNSYTTRNQLPTLLVHLAAAAEHPRHVDVATIFAGGASLRRHWNAGIAQKALGSSAWDYVVLQEQSTLPVKNPQRYHENVRLFAAEIAKHGARIALYLTWSRQQVPQTQDQITRAVEDIAAEVGARPVPVGPAWHAAMHVDPSLILYEDDGSHPTAAGSYLAACVFLATLFDERPSGWSVSDALKIDRAAAAKLQEVAWAFRATT
ncbi:MAG TPA: SGNH/GDSL hydrolase family protein [Casimicrobiaceae bacterium]|jgi:hypothetical protein